MSTKLNNPVVCCYCNKALDGIQNAASDEDAKQLPESGDMSLCIECGGVMVFCDDLTTRPVTPEDEAKLSANCKEMLGKAQMVYEMMKVIKHNKGLHLSPLNHTIN